MFLLSVKYKQLNHCIHLLSEIKIQHLRQSKALCLSSCQFGQLNGFVDFYSLKYLELCSLGIEKLPPKIAQAMPNLSTLNINYNDLRDLHPIRGLKHLEELSLVGNKIPYLPNLIETLSHFRHLKHLDLR
jgi:Leucine-rich repeat (LRR) protein